MTDRRDFLKTGGILSAAAFFNSCSTRANKEGKEANFSFCLNTSTIRGQNPGLLGYIDIAAEAGYDSLELWVRDVKAYLEDGNSASELKTYIENKGLSVENAIGFAPWLVPGEEAWNKGYNAMKEEMEIMASIGGKRIAAAPAGLASAEGFDYFESGRRLHSLIELGKSLGIMPQLEFWGASPVLNHFSQIIMIAAAANHPDVQLLPDIYHLFRGNSGFEALKMLQGNVIEVFHMNDYTDQIPREEQQDKDRVYPGDGVGPVRQVLSDLKKAGGNKVLSVELFNPEYWKEDAMLVAKTALEKMKSLVASI